MTVRSWRLTSPPVQRPLPLLELPLPLLELPLPWPWPLLELPVLVLVELALVEVEPVLVELALVEPVEVLVLPPPLVSQSVWLCSQTRRVSVRVTGPTSKKMKSSGTE